MKHTYLIFAILAVALIGAVIFYNLRFDRRKKKQEAEKPAPQNRRERRAAEQKQQQYQLRLEKVKDDYDVKYGKFLDQAAILFTEARVGSHSLTRFTNTLLGHLETFIWEYNQDSRKPHLLDRYVPAPYFMAMTAMCQLLDEYYVKYTNTSLQSITTELVRFVEKHFLEKSLSEVMQRHKGTVTFNDRNEAMSAAILAFFTDTIKHPLSRGRMLPVDFLSDSELYEPSVVQSMFNRIAVEDTYMHAMENAVKNEDFEKRERANKQMHQNNRQQRAKRLSRQARRR